MTKIKKIMLAAPSCTWFNERPWSIPPYTLAILKSVSPQDFEVEIMEPNLEDLSIEQVKEKIACFKPDLIGISCMSLEYAKSVHKMIEIAKSVNSEMIVLLGGVYGTVAPEITMMDKNIDYLIMGEGEKRFPLLLQSINTHNLSFDKLDGLAYRNGSELIVKPIATYIDDLDSLPFPDYDSFDYLAYAGESNKFSNVLLPRYFPYAITTSSRGCPYNCIYCSTHAIDGKKIRFKSHERVLSEIDWLVDKYGIRELIFMDDNLNSKKDRFKKIMKGLIKRNYDLHW